jgi:hypothetical protein
MWMNSVICGQRSTLSFRGDLASEVKRVAGHHWQNHASLPVVKATKATPGVMLFEQSPTSPKLVPKDGPMGQPSA